jgi:hypothetical protein
MKREESQTEEPRKTADAKPPRPSKELDGKTDSGPEPEVHGRDIPPQD